MVSGPASWPTRCLSPGRGGLPTRTRRLLLRSRNLRYVPSTLRVSRPWSNGFKKGVNQGDSGLGLLSSLAAPSGCRDFSTIWFLVGSGEFGRQALIRCAASAMNVSMRTHTRYFVSQQTPCQVPCPSIQAMPDQISCNAKTPVPWCESTLRDVRPAYGPRWAPSSRPLLTFYSPRPSA